MAATSHTWSGPPGSVQLTGQPRARGSQPNSWGVKRGHLSWEPQPMAIRGPASAVNSPEQRGRAAHSWSTCSMGPDSGCSEMTYVKVLARTLPCLMGSPCGGIFHPSSSRDLQPPRRLAPPLQAHVPSPGHPHSCQAVSSRKEKGTAAAVPTSFPASSWLSAGAHKRGLPPSGLGNMPSRRFLRRCRGHLPPS